MNVMRQTACLADNTIAVDNFDVLFNCTPAGGALDVMIIPGKTFRLSCLGFDALSLVRPTEFQPLDFCCSWRCC